MTFAEMDAQNRERREASAGAALLQANPWAATNADPGQSAASNLSPEASLLDWAVGRWVAEVKNRPLINVHRRSLDDTWRQVIRRLGGDPGRLVGPSHDDLLELAKRAKAAGRAAC